MPSISRRPCPICGGAGGDSAFPYATRFNNQTFTYLRCRSCQSGFVDPVPDADTFAKMYAKSAYHDTHYLDCDTAQYVSSVQLLSRFLPAGASVLDYGCGLGLFLAALKTAGFDATGVEFDQQAAECAGRNANCPTFSVATFLARPDNATFDALHLGDVLEHLPDPAATLRELLGFVKPGGLLFVEGPLENNPSPVFWAAQVFGALKKRLTPHFVGSSPPTHLLRVDAKQQQAFFTRMNVDLSLLHWQVYETGWPYASGGLVKRLIGRAAVALGGKEMAGVAFGNRFRGIFRLSSSVQP